MPTYTLTLIDVRRVQSYLFNANELRQNLGASLLVEQATHEWIIQHLPPRHNVKWEDENYNATYNGKTIEGDALDAEVIFMGGANAAILFESCLKANDFTKSYTRHVLLNAPGLEVAAGHTDCEWGQPNSLQNAWEKLQNQVMPIRKEGRAISQMLPGLAVTAECAFTGLPAVEDMWRLPDRGDDLVLVSAEVQAKRKPETVKAAKKRLTSLLPPGETFEYPDDLEKLGGEKGRSRYIAVVHADGNGMGKRIKENTTDENNRKMVEKMREFSGALNDAGLKAMKTVADWVRGMPEEVKGKDYIVRDRWERDELKFDTYLPLRPIVFGGDDVTFVCEGRLGLALAAKFLEAFHVQTHLPDGKPVYACAGVAIVQHNYPFARAYKLAEDLTQAAKKQAKKDDDQKRASLIHWHISTTGLTLDWDDIHWREFEVTLGDEKQTKTGDLLLRPLIVNKADEVRIQESWRNWDIFKAQLKTFRKDDAWKGRRNKLKELRETLRQGEGAVKDFTKVHGQLPQVIAGQNAHETGWYGLRCVYFDALEADDWFIYPLDRGQEVANA